MSRDLPPAPPGYTAQQSDGAFTSILPPNPYSQEDVQATPLEQLNEKPETVFCPFCRRVARTRIGNSHSNTTRYTWHSAQHRLIPRPVADNCRCRAVRAVWNSFWFIATAGPDMLDWQRNKNHVSRGQQCHLRPVLMWHRGLSIMDQKLTVRSIVHLVGSNLLVSFTVEAS